jgi:hypothetical protein
VGWRGAVASYALNPDLGKPEFDRESTPTRLVGCWKVAGADVTVVVDAEGGLTFQNRSPQRLHLPAAS